MMPIYQYTVAGLALSYYLTNWCLIVNWTLSNKFQWHFDKKKYFHENVDRKMSAILFRPQYVDQPQAQSRCRSGQHSETTYRNTGYDSVTHLKLILQWRNNQRDGVSNHRGVDA